VERALNRSAVALLLLLGAAAPACGRRAGAPSSLGDVVPRYTEARWQDVFARPPDLIVVVRPQSLRRDRVYGPLLRRAIELARAHSRLVAETGALDAMVDADEVIVGAWGTGGKETDDLLVVVRGVRADVDPAKLIDEEGHALWAAGPNGPAVDVRELLRARAEASAAGAGDTSLFELPGRTWVIATGKARSRARDAFSRSVPRERESTGGSARLEDRASPASAAAWSQGDDGSALGMVRLGGKALVARVRELRPPSLLAPLGRKLQQAAIVLSPGEDAVVRATLSYEDEEAAALAEATVRRAIEALLVAKRDDYAWLRSVAVQRAPGRVMVTAPVPQRLLDGLLDPGKALPDGDLAPH
jgi:hypothetical protein